MQTLLWVCPEQSFWVEGWRSLMVQMHFASTWTCAKELWDAWLPLLPRLFLSWPAAGIAKFHGAFWIGKRWQQKPSLPPLPREPIDMPISSRKQMSHSFDVYPHKPHHKPNDFLIMICKSNLLLPMPHVCSSYVYSVYSFPLAVDPMASPACLTGELLHPCTWLGAVQNPQPATKESPNEEDPWGHLSHLSHLPNHRWTGSRSF